MDVAQKDIPIYTEWVATTDGSVNATIRAQVQGYLLKQNYQEGHFVKAGDILFEIDPRPFEATLNRAKAALRASEAAAIQAKAVIARTEAQHNIARADLDRIKPLAAEEAVSQKELDDAAGAEQSTRAAVIAEQSAAGAAEASVAVAKAAVETAQLELEFTKIVSPISGMAGIPKAQVGDLVGPSQQGELATVSTVDPIKVYFSATEQDYFEHMQKVQDGTPEQEGGDKYELVLSNGTVYPHKGKFYAFDREVDVNTGTIRVELFFPNPDNLLRPGQFAKVRTSEQRKGVLLVPQRAVTDLQGNRQVMVVGTDNKVEIRAVKTGSRVDNLWVINEGLKPGERIVAEGTQKVRSGILVNPVAAAEPTASPATAVVPAAGTQPPTAPASGAAG